MYDYPFGSGASWFEEQRSAPTNRWVHTQTVQLCEYCGCYGLDESNKCKSCGAPMTPVVSNHYDYCSSSMDGNWITST